MKLSDMLKDFEDYDAKTLNALTGIDLRKKNPDDPNLRRMPWKQERGPQRPHWAVEQAVGGLPDNPPLVDESDEVAVTLASLLHPALRSMMGRGKAGKMGPKQGLREGSPKLNAWVESTEELPEMEMARSMRGGPGPMHVEPPELPFTPERPPGGPGPSLLDALEMRPGMMGGPGPATPQNKFGAGYWDPEGHWRGRRDDTLRIPMPAENTTAPALLFTTKPGRAAKAIRDEQITSSAKGKKR